MKPEELLALLAAALGPQLQAGAGGPHYRATPSTPSLPYYTGPGGLFGVPGLSREIFSTRIQPIGLADRLPVQMTNEMNPLFPYFTGFTAGSGTEPNGVCDDPPTAGASTNCIQTAQFGRFSRQTRTFEVNRLGQQINRGEFLDLTIVNNPIAGGIGSPAVPAGVQGGPGPGGLSREVFMRMLELGVDFQEWMSRKLFEGNPANNTGGGGYREFPGLDILVGTNKRDALTGTPCPSLNSDIKDYNYGDVGVAGTGDTRIVNVLSYMMRFLRMNAEGMNMGDVNWVFVMRPSAFWELTAAWPCAYMTDRCGFGSTTGASINVDAGDMIAMRDSMRNERFITIDGIRYPVILDNTLREDTSGTNNRLTAGNFSSDIYILPLSVRGGIPVLYWELFDYRTSLEILGDGQMASQYFWSDGGRYLWHLKPPTNFCIQYLAKIEPRIILRTPHLAGRLLNVRYRPLQHENDPFLTDPYNVGGGVGGGRARQPLYSDWNPTVPAVA